jgi:hypothetical protein
MYDIIIGAINLILIIGMIFVVVYPFDPYGLRKEQKNKNKF